ncbi:MAG: hypothetical protein R2684_12965 [Pyrinomonadaceae bacterium]
MVRMEMCRNCFVVFAFAIFVLTAHGQELKNHKDTQIKFEILRARLMGVEERYRKQSDNIGIDISVKIRLSNMGRTTIYYYTDWSESILPYGHLIKETANGIVWFDGFHSLSKNPLGISTLTLGGGGAWLRLDSETSIEYESFDSSTHAEEKHARTCFMKVGSKGKITQVFSDFYTVPTNADIK